MIKRVISIGEPQEPRQCPVCKRKLPIQHFIDTVNLFKLCEECREKGRIANAKRKEARSKQAKEHYQVHKEDISKRNKEWRKKNKNKLSEYEKSDFRKQKNKEWREQKRVEDRFRFVWYAAKRRAKAANVPFTISKRNIIDIFPSDGKCPMLGIELQFNNKKSCDNSPSLDRIIPSVGYVPGNIQLISYRANRIKNDASLEELKSIVAFLERGVK